MTDTTAHDWDGCLMCAVRALTEGRPREWSTTKDLEPGTTITGVVVKNGEQPSYWSDGRAPFLDLWLGGVERVRVAGHSLQLRDALEAIDAQIGDTVTVTFGGSVEITTGRLAGQMMKTFTASVERGHH